MSVPLPRWRGHSTTAVAVAALVMTSTACGGGSTSTADASATTGVSITVALPAERPPQALLDEFTAETGIKVTWVNLDWTSLQTKISASATSKTYFADATNVDWSRVGQLGKLGWFTPLEEVIDTTSMQADVPQLASFTADQHVVGVPYDASFMVTTVNQDLFAKAGITEMPTTMDQYTNDLEAIKAAGVLPAPLNIPFAAAESLSTYWYQATKAFGGTVLDAKGAPQFTDKNSGGYRAAQWMVDAMQKGLVPEGNINVTDSQGQQTLMAQGQVASTLSDYSGLVGNLYNVEGSSTVSGKVHYLPTPGTTGVTTNLSNPDGIGIPVAAKHPAAAAKFIEWFTSSKTQADFAGLNGQDRLWSGYPLPSHVSVVEQMATAGGLAEGDVLAEMLKTSAPVFPDGAPTWYPEFSKSVYTSLHDAATGSITVDEAINHMATTAEKLSSGS